MALPDLNSLKNMATLVFPERYHRVKFTEASAGRLATAEANRYYLDLAHAMTNLSRENLVGPWTLSEENADSGSLNAAASLQAHPSLPLSIVTITRNDTHVERMEERTQAFIDGILDLAQCLERPTELIIVEWNPPDDRPRMAQAFRFPKKHDYVSIRVVTVPSDVHQKFNMGSTLPLYQMIGKNVGIRRARGRMIAVTNIDVLFSKALFSQMSDETLAAGYHYRSDRWDVDRSILDLQSPAERAAAAPDLCLNINTIHGTLPPSKDDLTAPQFLEGPFIPLLHIMACGDFQMLHRDDWARVRGYPELDAFSMHLDSLFAIQCHYAGLMEHIFPRHFSHYHIDHTLGSQVKDGSYFTQEKHELKHVSLNTLVAVADSLRNTEKAIAFNGTDWGMPFRALQDERLTLGAWDCDSLAYAAPASSGNRLSACAIDLVKLEEWSGAYIAPATKDVLQMAATFIRTASAQRPLYIWGAGGRGLTLAASLFECNVQVVAFVDGAQASGFTGSLHGIPVIAGRDFLNNMLTPAPFIVIASMHALQIEEGLRSEGLIEGEDYIIAV